MWHRSDKNGKALEQELASLEVKRKNLVEEEKTVSRRCIN